MEQNTLENMTADEKKESTRRKQRMQEIKCAIAYIFMQDIKEIFDEVTVDPTDNSGYEYPIKPLRRDTIIITCQDLVDFVMDKQKAGEEMTHQVLLREYIRVIDQRLDFAHRMASPLQSLEIPYWSIWEKIGKKVKFSPILNDPMLEFHLNTLGLSPNQGLESSPTEKKHKNETDEPKHLGSFVSERLDTKIKREIEWILPIAKGIFSSNLVKNIHEPCPRKLDLYSIKRRAEKCMERLVRQLEQFYLSDEKQIPSHVVRSEFKCIILKEIANIVGGNEFGVPEFDVDEKPIFSFIDKRFDELDPLHPIPKSI